MDVAAVKLDDALRLPYTSKSADFLVVAMLAILGWVPLEQERICIRIVRLVQLAQYAHRASRSYRFFFTWDHLVMRSINLDDIFIRNSIASAGFLARDREESLISEMLVEHMGVEHRNAVHPLLFTKPP